MKIRKLIGLYIVLVGALIFTYPFLSMSIGDLTQINRNKTFDREIGSDIRINEKRDLIKSDSSDTEISDNKKLFSVFESDVKISDDVSKYDKKKLREVGLDLNKKMGYVKIPKLGKSFDLYLDADYVKISKGVAVLRGSDPPVGGIGKRCVIAGHNGYYNNPIFMYINRLENNDDIVVNFLGEEVKYKVFGKEIISPTDWEKLEPREDEDMLTLLTCIQIPRYNHRLLVNARRVDTGDFDDSRKGNASVSDKSDRSDKIENNDTKNKDYSLFGYLLNSKYAWNIKIKRVIPYVLSLVGIFIVLFVIRRIFIICKYKG